MAGIVTVCIGQRGCGKTTLSKKLLDQRPKNMPVLIYDVNQEYGRYYDQPLEEIDDFMPKISDPELGSHFILLEESTIFFSTHRRDQDMVHALVVSRHTGNVVQMNFHSFLSLPKYIYTLTDYVIVFKTHDTEKMVLDKFDHPGVMAAYKEVQASKDEHFYKTVKI